MFSRDFLKFAIGYDHILFGVGWTAVLFFGVAALLGVAILLYDRSCGGADKARKVPHKRGELNMRQRLVWAALSLAVFAGAMTLLWMMVQVLRPEFM